MSKFYKFLLPLFALALLLVRCAPSSPTAPVQPEAQTQSSSTRSFAFDGKILSGKHLVTIKTTKGDIDVELDADAAPKTVTNFITLAKNGYYNGLMFHRVIPGFMIQGGDPSGNGTGGESIFGSTFEDEISATAYGMEKKTVAQAAEGQQVDPEVAKLTLEQFFTKKGYAYNNALPSLPMKRGAIAMANRGPNTNGSQFFIIQAKETPWLEGQHTVFGRVTKGLDVVDAIATAPRDASDKPVEPITYTVVVK